MNNQNEDMCPQPATSDKDSLTALILTWSVYQMPGSRSDIIIRHLAAIVANAVSYGTSLGIWWEVLKAETYLRNLFIVTAVASTSFFIKIMRQKTAYHYRVFEGHAVLDHHVYYSALETNIIRSITLICMLGFLGVALFTGSPFLLIGPAAIGLVAGLRLLNFKNPISRRHGIPWNRYNFVTVDRKRKIIITHQSDLTLGFEARLPDDLLFKQYLDFLKKSLPSTALFTEKGWKHDLI